MYNLYVQSKGEMSMSNLKRRRYSALAMATVLGVGSIVGGNRLVDKTKAETRKVSKVVFQEGYGTGSDFSESSWLFMGLEKNSGKQISGDGKEPAIEVDNKYLKNGEKVIRLINGVKAETNRSTGLEASGSYSEYRTGEAFLSEGIHLSSDASFAAKFTFSMPEAVVNPVQTGGEEFAREVGGDGIAFVMTTNSKHEVQAGSGIGYQGIGESIAIEFDSYFNGAYCDMSESAYAYKNWGFDNQLYFHQNSSLDGNTNYPGMTGGNPWTSADASYKYVNYENTNYAERFDHVAIVEDGDVKTHKEIKYINDIDPTENVGGKYVNLANRYGNKNTGTAEESSSANCLTRFADKGVDDRLFTVWVDYNGSTMDISYANGDFATAVKPEKPQIDDAKINLAKFNNQTIYMGFTSAVGSSKANHTIHSFQFTNVFETSYKMNYYLKDKATGEYVLDKSTDIYNGEIGSTVKAEDVDAKYKDAYKDKNYILSTEKEQEVSVKLQEAEKVYEMNVYYDPAEAYYLLNYYKYDTDKKEYVLEETTKTATGFVGDTYKITDVDASYGTKYPNYAVNTEKQQDFSVELSEAGKTYEMNVYYDPEKAGYKLNYHKLNPNTGLYEYIESTTVKEGIINKTYEVTDADADYEKKYEKDNYVVNKEKDETYSVLIKDDSKTYEMDVYYDPVKTTYKTEHYLQNPDGSYSLKDTVKGEETYAGKEVVAVEKTYDGYTHVIIPESVEKEVVNADGSTTMKLYYNLEGSPTYEVEYYVEQEDGTYKLYTEKTGIAGTTGQNVSAEIIAIPGYTHTTTENSNESDVVKEDSSTILKVYYNLEKVDPTTVPTIAPTATPTVAPTVEPTVAPTVKPTVAPTQKTDNTGNETDDIEVPEETKKPNKPKATKAPEVVVPKTGDENNMGAYIALMLSSIAVAFVTLVTRKKDEIE